MVKKFKMSKPDKKKSPKTQEINLVKVGKHNDGYDLYAPLDKLAVDTLAGRKTFSAKIPVVGRSLNQNSLWAIWYGQIARELKEDNAEAVKRECKLLYGVPILLAEDESFRRVWMAKFANDTYEQQIFMMRYLPVTSLLKRGQGVIYTESLQRAYAGRVRLEVL
jgi:hypothetical protein